MRSRTATAALIITAALLAGGAWLARRSSVAVPAASGPGGVAAAHTGPRENRRGSPPAPSSPAALGLAVDAYDRGRWSDSERLARRALESAPAGDESGSAGVRARWVLAFSAARRGDTRLARERFALLRDAAAKHPSLAFRSEPVGDGPRVPGEAETAAVPPERPLSDTGEPLPTLEEEGV